jgi:hypothetical protein
MNLEKLFKKVFPAFLASLMAGGCLEPQGGGQKADGGLQLCKYDRDCTGGKKCLSGVCRTPQDGGAGCQSNEDCDGGGAYDAGLDAGSGDGSQADVPEADDAAFQDAGKDASGDGGASFDGGFPDGGAADGGASNSCSTACDCSQGYFCHQSEHVCMYMPERVTYCCEKPDCPAGHGCVHYSGALDFCPPSGNIPCGHHCDCPQGMSCTLGKCIKGSSTVYCCDNLGCPKEAACVKRAGSSAQCPDQAGWECIRPCDCMSQMNDCQDHKCIWSDKVAYCCDLRGCKKGEACVRQDGISTSVCMSCQEDCDCPQGYMCAIDECLAMSITRYCCAKAGCPGGADCSTLSGGFGTCKGSTSPCTSHCDCPQGWYCESQVCKEDIIMPVYCCELPGCPEYEGCKDRNGVSGTCPKSL